MLGLFKKRKDILAVVLTSSDVKRARRAYESIKNSPKSVSMDIEIIVNSLNKHYRAEVEKEFAKDKVKITETQSNGRCGKGKNTVIDHFRNHKNSYDYLMPVDGDDFFYPSAFEQFEKMLSKGPDILGLQASDMLISENDHRTKEFIDKSQETQNEFIHHIQNELFLHSWNDLEINLCKEFPKDVHKKVSEQYPPDRTLFMSANLLKNEKDLCFPEEISVYDDYVFCVRLYEKAINNGYSYAHFSNSYCYLYDRINEGSVTVTYKEFNQSREHFNQEFPKLIKDALVKCDNEIDFTIIPHFKLGLPRSFTHENKIDFIKKQIIK